MHQKERKYQHNFSDTQSHLSNQLTPKSDTCLSLSSSVDIANRTKKYIKEKVTDLKEILTKEAKLALMLKKEIEKRR